MVTLPGTTHPHMAQSLCCRWLDFAPGPRAWVGCWLLWLAVAAAVARPAAATPSLAAVLQPDGSLRPDRQDSYATDGWQMHLAADGHPVFSPQPLAPINQAAGSAQPRSGLHPDGVWAIAFIGHDLYAGGHFSDVGGVPAHNIARWDGRAWHSLGQGPDNGVNSTVKSLAGIGKTLYVGGDFDRVGGTPAQEVAAWDGRQWRGLGWMDTDTPEYEAINTMTAVGTDLYVGGAFAQAGTVAAKNLARWDGQQWHALGAVLPDALSDGVNTLAVHGERLYAEGNATNDPYFIPQLAYWNIKSATWHLLPPPPVYLIGINHPDSVDYPRVTSLAATDSALYLGYKAHRKTNAQGLLRWNGHRWDLLGVAGLKGRGILALAAAGNDVYVAGNFKQIGEKTACNVVRWSNNRWEVLQTDFSWNSPIAGIVWTVAVRRGVVYAGGYLKCRIARWHKNRWVALPPTPAR